MFPFPNGIVFSGTYARSEAKIRAFKPMPGYRFMPSAGLGPLDKHRPTSAARVRASSVTNTKTTVNCEDVPLQVQVEACDYSQLSRKLIVFFQWRGADAPEDLAQETLQRGFSRLAEGVELHSPPAHYFFAIAHRVLLESWRTRHRDPFCAGVDLEAFSAYASVDDRAGHADRLEECLSTLSSDDRHVVVRYYEGDREKLSSELGVDANALRVRVHRAIRKIRSRLAETPASPASSDQAACLASRVKIGGRTGPPAARHVAGEENLEALSRPESLPDENHFPTRIISRPARAPHR